MERILGDEMGKKGKDLKDLKRELDLDEHKIKIEDLYRRYGTDPKKVRRLLKVIYS